MPNGLRANVGQAVRTGLEARGFQCAQRGRLFVRSLEPPLEAIITPVIEGHRYGGVALSGTVKIFAGQVADFCQDRLPDEAWWSARRPRSLDGYFLKLAQFGELLPERGSHDFQWQIEDRCQLDGGVDEFLAVVDGGGAAWIQQRSSVEGLLANLRGGDPRTSGMWGRTGSVLAMQCDRPVDAQALLELMAADDRQDEDDRVRLSAFAATLKSVFLSS